MVSALGQLSEHSIKLGSEIRILYLNVSQLAASFVDQYQLSLNQKTREIHLPELNSS